MYTFRAEIEIIGINPFVFVPEQILSEIFKQAGKEKGHIPVKGNINGKSINFLLSKERFVGRDKP